MLSYSLFHTSSFMKKSEGLMFITKSVRITKDIYDKKLKEYKEKQYEIGIRLEEYTQADKSYHITASTVFNMAKRALDVFESSEVLEKRQFLNYLLQNPKVDGKKLVFDLRSPFNHIASLASQPIGLRR